MATLRPGRQFTRLIAAAKDLGHIRNSDAQSFRDLAHGLSGIAAGKDTVTKILRVSHPTSPRHLNLRSTPTRGRRIACTPDSQLFSRFQSRQARSNADAKGGF